MQLKGQCKDLMEMTKTPSKAVAFFVCFPAAFAVKFIEQQDQTASVCIYYLEKEQSDLKNISHPLYSVCDGRSCLWPFSFSEMVAALCLGGFFCFFSHKFTLNVPFFISKTRLND